MRAVASDNLGSPLRAVVRIIAYLVFTSSMIPVQCLALAFGSRLQKTIPVWYHRRCCRLLGIRVERRGRPSPQHPVLFVSNHCSYLDISVLGSLVPASFVARADMAAWPLFGLLARLQRSVFVERRTFRAAEHRDVMMSRLEAGDNLILFAEGTSSDGNRVLPFKSALLSAAETEPQGRPLAVQPVSVAYTMLDGMPLGRYLRPFFAWYGDMDMAGHVWQWAGLGRLTVVVQFHPAVTLAEFESRKALSDHCYRVVSRGMADALAGRRRRALKREPPGAAAATPPGEDDGRPPQDPGGPVPVATGRAGG